MITIDLNCDLGEDPAAIDRDLALLELVTSANVACGGHAGDEATMAAIVGAARARGVAVGAHPGYPDRANLGRARMEIAIQALEASIREQVAALATVAASQGVRLAHVKPHGALYHEAGRSEGVAAAIARAVRRVSPALVMVAQAGSAALGHYAGAGMRVMAEGFADRRYEADGSLRARTRPGALIEDPEEAAHQAVRIARGEGVLAGDGSVVRLRAETICIHSDTPGALVVARRVREGLAAAGILVRP